MQASSPQGTPQPTPSSPTRLISPDALAAAAERRSQSQPQVRTAAQLAQEHERKQKFRRMIDPGIMRPNPKEQAVSSLKTLLKIAENLLNEPDNPKFRQFKPTNTLIKRELVDRKGALEYAIEMGFGPTVENFQPYYRWNPRHMEELKVGAEMLEEALLVIQRKEEQANVSKLSQKEVQAQIAEKVRLAYIEDRKTKQERDEMERQVRQARALSGAGPSSSRSSRATSVPVAPMPGEGERLIAPPPYEAAGATGASTGSAPRASHSGSDSDSNDAL